MMKMPQIFFDDISKVYGCTKKHHALQNFVLSLERGEFMGLVGPNGSGKSTALKILTNVAFPTSGRVEINGICVNEDPEGALSGVGSLVDVPGFDTYHTPRSFYKYCGTLIGLDKETISSEIDRVLNSLDMDKWADWRINKFSKGMRQRIALGQALLGDPEILVMDEPLSGLDPDSNESISRMLASLKDEMNKKTVIMATHNLSEVYRLCDSVAVIDSGRLVAKRAIDDQSHRERSIRMRVNSLQPLGDVDISRLQSEDFIYKVETRGNETIISISNDEESKSRLITLLDKLGIEIYEISEEEDYIEKYQELLKSGGHSQ